MVYTTKKVAEEIGKAVTKENCQNRTKEPVTQMVYKQNTAFLHAVVRQNKRWEICLLGIV